MLNNRDFRGAQRQGWILLGSHSSRVAKALIS